MATLTIKNIPEPLVKRLKQQAAAHRRSLNFEVIAYLEQMAHSVPVDAEALPARQGRSAGPPQAFDSPIVYSVISEWDSEGPSNSRYLAIAFADLTEVSQISTTRLLKISPARSQGVRMPRRTVPVRRGGRTTENEAGGNFQQPVYSSRMAP